jgi:hypothetical protein
LASDAEAWALQMAVIGEFARAPQRENGENFACFKPVGERNYVAATQAWLSEKIITVVRRRLERKWRIRTRWWAIIRLSSGPKLGGWEWDTSMSRKIASGRHQAGRMWLRYDVMQTVGQTAWRLSRSIPYGYTAEGWEEELWIQRFGKGNHL